MKTADLFSLLPMKNSKTIFKYLYTEHVHKRQPFCYNKYMLTIGRVKNKGRGYMWQTKAEMLNISELMTFQLSSQQLEQITFFEYIAAD